MRSARQPARRPRKPFAALRGPARVPGLLLRPPAPPLRPAALPRRTGAAGAEAGSGAGAPGSGRRSAQRSSATLMWNHCSGPARCRATAGASAQLWGRGAPPSSQHVDMYMKVLKFIRQPSAINIPEGPHASVPMRVSCGYAEPREGAIAAHGRGAPLARHQRQCPAVPVGRMLPPAACPGRAATHQRVGADVRRKRIAAVRIRQREY